MEGLEDEKVSKGLGLGCAAYPDKLVEELLCVRVPLAGDETAGELVSDGDAVGVEEGGRVFEEGELMCGVERIVVGETCVLDDDTPQLDGETRRMRVMRI